MPRRVVLALCVVCAVSAARVAAASFAPPTCALSKEFDKGVDALRRSKVDDAISILSRAFSQDGCARSALWLAYAYAQQQDVASTIWYASKAQDARPPLAGVEASYPGALLGWATSPSRRYAVSVTMSTAEERGRDMVGELVEDAKRRAQKAYAQKAYKRDRLGDSAAVEEFAKIAVDDAAAFDALWASPESMKDLLKELIAPPPDPPVLPIPADTSTAGRG
jgi:hypothetical protein